MTSMEGKTFASTPFSREILDMAYRKKSTSSTFLEYLVFAAAIRGLRKAGLLSNTLVKARSDSEAMCKGFENASTAAHMFPLVLIIIEDVTLSSAGIQLGHVNRDKNAMADGLGRSDCFRHLPADFTRIDMPVDEILDDIKYLC